MQDVAPTDLASAAARLDLAVSDLTASVAGVHLTVADLADLADRWDGLADHLEAHAPALASDARRLAEALRAATAPITAYAHDRERAIGPAGLLADRLTRFTSG